MYSKQSAVSDGTLVTLAVTLAYQSRDEIDVTFDPAYAGTWSWVGPTSTTLSFSPAVGAGTTVNIKRTTKVDTMRHVFASGAAFLARTVDADYTQLLHLAQEQVESPGGGGTGGVSTWNGRGGEVVMTGADLTNAAGSPVLTQANAGTSVVSSFNTRKGAVVLTGQDVTAALGYIPGSSTGGVLTFNGRDGLVTLTNSDLTAAAGGTVVTTPNLAATSGAALIGYQRAGTGAIPRTMSQFISATRVTPEDFGAIGNGTTDDTAAVQAALDSLPLGGAVYCTRRYHITAPLNVPRGTSLQGNFEVVGNGMVAGGSALPYGDMQSALILDSVATINLGWNAGIRGMLIHRFGMNFPEPDSSAYAGTAIIANGDDVFLHNSMVLGFTQAFYSTGHGRADIRVVNIDCNAGIDIRHCLDVAYCERVHCWPFVTITGTVAISGLHRTGAAFRFQDVGDWNKLTNCFSYGYFRGYLLHAVSAMTLISCSADSTSSFVGQIGFEISGFTNDTRLVSCQAAGQHTGYYFHQDAGLYASMVGCDAWAATTNSVAVDSGDVSIFQGHLRDCAQGVVCASSTSKVTVADVCLRRVSGASIANPGGTSTLYIRNNLYIDVGSILPDFPATGGGGGGPTTASAVTFTPTGTISSTNVQAALAEVASESATVNGSSIVPFSASTPPAGDNTFRVANTGWYWIQKATSISPGASGSGGLGATGRWADEAHFHPATAATATAFTPTGTISSTNVQAAIAEVAAEAAALNGNAANAFFAATPGAGDNSSRVANTGWYWIQKATSVSPAASGGGAVGTTGRWADEGHQHPATAVPVASAIAFTPTATIAASNVQSALAELSTEKAELAGNIGQPFQASAYFGGYGSFTNAANTTVPGLVAVSVNPTVQPAVKVDGSMNSVAYAAAGSAGIWRANAIIPIAHNTYELGNGGSAWSAIFSQTALIVTSDARHKVDVADSNLGLDFINKLRPVSYRYKVEDDGHNATREGRRTHYGLLAQEVKEALGDTDAGIWVISDTADPDSKQMLRYEELIGPMIKAIQELRARVDALTKE